MRTEIKGILDDMDKTLTDLFDVNLANLFFSIGEKTRYNITNT